MTGDRFEGCLLGLAMGDALGTSVEFRPRGTFEPITDLTGGGAFGLKPGEWTDDTSMALCLATSLVEEGCFDPDDQIRRYCRWKQVGYLSSTGKCFGVGGTVDKALTRYIETGEANSGSTHVRSAGNGSIMRLAPVPMYFFPDRISVIRYSAESSRTTHGTAECLDACRLLGAILFECLNGAVDRAQVLLAGKDLPDLSPGIRAIAAGEYLSKEIAEIKGSGYVVESLEAALWCFFKTEDYRDAVLAAANLGDDADTTAAICGQVAGAFYGAEAIPESWLQKLVMREEITRLSSRLQTAQGVA